MRSVYALICRRLLVDAQSKMPSYIDCVDRLLAPNVPRVEGADGVLLPVGLNIVSAWTRDAREVPERGHGRMRLLLPDGKDLMGEVFAIDLDATPNHIVRMDLSLHPFTVHGRYWHVVERQNDEGSWTEVARIPLDIDAQEALPPPAVLPS